MTWKGQIVRTLVFLLFWMIQRILTLLCKICLLFVYLLWYCVYGSLIVVVFWCSVTWFYDLFVRLFVLWWIYCHSLGLIGRVLGFNSLKTKIKSVKSVISDPGYIIHLWTQYWGVQSLFTLYFFHHLKSFDPVQDTLYEIKDYIVKDKLEGLTW